VFGIFVTNSFAAVFAFWSCFVAFVVLVSSSRCFHVKQLLFAWRASQWLGNPSRVGFTPLPGGTTTCKKMPAIPFCSTECLDCLQAGTSRRLLCPDGPHRVSANPTIMDMTNWFGLFGAGGLLFSVALWSRGISVQAAGAWQGGLLPACFTWNNSFAERLFSRHKVAEFSLDIPKYYLRVLLAFSLGRRIRFGTFREITKERFYGQQKERKTKAPGQGASVAFRSDNIKFGRGKPGIS
jgi:hypothetical protein